MSKLALGLIETVGLAAGIEAADVAVKSANVKLIGYELSNGGGMVTVKFEGDVGAVKAAVDAAAYAAGKISTVVSKQVIPRPSAEIDKIVFTAATVGFKKVVEAQPEEISSEEVSSEETSSEEASSEDPEPEPTEGQEQKGKKRRRRDLL